MNFPLSFAKTLFRVRRRPRMAVRVEASTSLKWDFYSLQTASTGGEQATGGGEVHPAGTAAGTM